MPDVPYFFSFSTNYYYSPKIQLCEKGSRGEVWRESAATILIFPLNRASTVHFFFIFPKFRPQFEVLKEGFQHERGPVAQISPNLAGRPSVIDEPVDFSHFVPPAPLLPLRLPPKLLPYANYSPLLLLFYSMAD